MKTNKETDILELLDEAWRQQDRSLYEAASHRPVTVDALHKPRPLRRRQVVVSLLSVALSLVCIAVMGLIYKRYVVDIYDLIAHLLVGVFLVALAVLAFKVLRRNVNPVEPRHLPVVAAVALLLVLTVVATPAYAGRAMNSDDSHSKTIAQIDNFLRSPDN